MWFNGNAGWSDVNDTIGICQAELDAAHRSAPGKVFIVDIHEPKARGAPEGATHATFQDYVTRLRPFAARAGTVNEAGLVAAVRRTVSQATVKMIQRGVREANPGTNYVGPALDWTSLGYAERSLKMQAAALGALNQNS